MSSSSSNSLTQSQWTVKYTPKTTQDLVGNGRNYAKLVAWLKQYRDKRRDPKFPKLALMGGPPGIGKTSGILAIANEFNLQVVEFNASDQRNADVITRQVSRAAKTQPTFGFDGKIVLLDEVDGIAGNEDRGGLSALLKVAKEAFHPIVCTANDPSNQRLRSLKNASLFLKFGPPERQEIVQLLQRIAIAEGLEVHKAVFMAISDNAHGDIRAAVNDLENLSFGRTQLGPPDIRALNVRDSETSIDSAFRQIFGGARTVKNAHEVTSDLDVDYSMFLNYVVENIPAHANSPEELEDMMMFAAEADLVLAEIVFTQHWTLLKYFYFYLSAGIRSAKQSTFKHQTPRFPSRLIELSRTRKVRGIRDSVALKLGKIEHTSKAKVVESSLPFVRLQYEALFEQYSSKEGLTITGTDLLRSLAEVQAMVEFEEEELLYLFNDPLYNKPTKTQEKKQKELIKLLRQEAEKVEAQHVQEFNKMFRESRRHSGEVDGSDALFSTPAEPGPSPVTVGGKQSPNPAPAQPPKPREEGTTTTTVAQKPTKKKPRKKTTPSLESFTQPVKPEVEEDSAKEEPQDKDKTTEKKRKKGKSLLDFM